MLAATSGFFSRPWLVQLIEPNSNWMKQNSKIFMFGITLHGSLGQLAGPQASSIAKEMRTASAACQEPAVSHGIGNVVKCVLHGCALLMKYLISNWAHLECSSRQ
jgi:hypothetical protein